MKGKRRESFIAAVDQNYIDCESINNYGKSKKFYPITFYKMVNTVASNFLDDPKDRKYYADSYTCCPPPLFIITITIIEVSRQEFILGNSNPPIISSSSLFSATIRLPVMVMWDPLDQYPQIVFSFIGLTKKMKFGDFSFTSFCTQGKPFSPLLVHLDLDDLE